MFSTTYSPRSITEYNREIEHLFYRFNIPSRSTRSIEEITAEKELNSDFILDLIKCYDDYENLESTKFVSYRIPTLVDYLEKSHKHYITKRIPEIEQCLFRLLRQQDNPLIYVILSFFEEYKKDLIQHFKTEDELIFPYCKSLYNFYYFKKEDDFLNILENGKKALEFMKKHKTSKDELKKLQETVLSYKVPVKNLSFFHVFIEQLSLFQKDLKIHGEIEDNVLQKKVLHINDILSIKYV